MFSSKDIFLGKGGATGYQISRSVRTRSSASAYFNRTPASAGNRQKWTWSGWVKRGSLSSTGIIFGALQTGTTGLGFGFQSTNEFYYSISGVGNFATTAVYRDPSAWYHIVFVLDTTQATQANRSLLYINGVNVSFSSNGIVQNNNYDINNNVAQYIGQSGVSSQYFDGYLTEINFIDGQALTPSSFGATSTTTGVWGPAKYTGTYGTNGFYLNFSDNSNNTATTIGKDSSGNGNNWTPNNISVTTGATYDSMVDTPTPYGSDSGAGGEVRGNYATMNPLAPSGGSMATLIDANLTNKGLSAGFWGTFLSSIAVSSGKWYAEFTMGGGTYNSIGILDVNPLPSGYASSSNQYAGIYPKGYSYQSDNGNKVNNNSTAAYGGTFTAVGTVISVALDLSAGTLVFYKNGVSQGTAYSSLSGLFAFAVGCADTASLVYANFGQRAFAYTAPSGFKALCTQNLSTPTIANGAGYVNATLYNGNSSTQTVNNSAGFYPDFNWIKIRSGAGTHVLVNSVAGGSKQLFSNTTNAEQTDTNITSAISSSGIALGNNSSGTGNTNITGSTYVLWQWLAGAGSSSSNTSGTITSTVSAGATQGFSVVSYTGNGTAGATVGHGLGVVPSMIIVKERSPDTNYNWFVYHTSLGNTAYLLLNTTNGSSSGVSAWNNTTPTSSVFTVGSYTEVNKNTAPFIAYCFAPIAGYSAFGLYTGNGSTDGTFVYTGFRPRFILYKPTIAGATDWVMWDTVRSTYNVQGNYLLANTAGAEGSATVIDILSNGFKLRTSTTGNNGSGDTIVYAAFAENPFKYALAR